MKAVEILLAEDNQHDVVFTRAALKEARIANNLHVVNDGFECLQFLRKEGDYSEAVRPSIILLDLNMPNMGGMDVLEVIKHDADLRRIPVVVLTSSHEERDVMSAYDRYVNAYITKPMDPVEFTEVIHGIETFWLRIVELPNGHIS